MSENELPSVATEDVAISPGDIAIVGMAAHLPGARNVREYWRNLRAGVESVKTFTEDELAASGVARELYTRSNYVRTGVVLDDVEHFDAEFFGLSPKEAAIMDPQHRHFLECAWEALEDAGHPPEAFAGPIGVFGGCGMGSYFVFNLLTNKSLVDSVGLFLLRHTGNDKDFLATRVSYCFNLTGPSINIQTACSTSLVAVHAASQSLLSGECDMALAGGVTIELPHRRGYLYHEGEILSPDGHCRAFDHRSQGTIFGSGAGVVVLRRAEDAVRDGDHIYALIKGSAINNDGSGKVGYLAPSVDGQAKAIIEALSVAGVSADTIDYVEAHGTGTAMGDPIEISALTQAFRGTTKKSGYCGIGSVKTNIGHLDTAAGIASLIKVALALQAAEIPPTLNFQAPNPAIPFDKTPFLVNASLKSWPRNSAKPRRAGVNSLGVGGTNAHVVLEEAPQRTGEATKAPHQLLVLSARSKKALDQATQDLARHLGDHPEQSLADVAYTLKAGRRAFAKRRVLACSSREEAVKLLESQDPRRVHTHSADGRGDKIAFMFPGGGAQHVGMGRGLYEREAVFRHHIDRGVEEFRKKCGIDLARFFLAHGSAAELARELERPSLQLPCLFILEYALAQLWISKGIQPTALIGHSLGENTAACVAGVFGYSDALGLVTLRGQLFERAAPGGMLSVSLPAAEVERHLGPHLDLAVVNARELCVASGPTAEIDALAARLAAREIEARRIPIAIAAHSRMLEPILEEFGAYLARIELFAPKIPIVSNKTGTWLTDAEARDPRYWVEHLRRTIRFADGIAKLLEEERRVLLEVGPGKILSSLAKQHDKIAATHNVIPSLRHADEDVDDHASFLTSFGRLWASGVDIDSKQLWNGERRMRVSLPTYPFQRQRYWIEPGKGATHDAAPSDERPERLASFDAWFREPVWKEAAFDLADLAPKTWLLFVDQAGVGDELAQHLSALGHDVLSVYEGDAYRRSGQREFTLSPEHGRDGYDALVKDLLAAGKIPHRIVHLWMVTEGESFRPGSSFFHRNQERGFYSLFFLAQALGDEGIATPISMQVVSNGMQRVHGETLAYPDKATLLGPCRVIPRELANITCSSIDIALTPTKPKKTKKKAVATLDSIDLLLKECSMPATNAIVAHRNGARFVWTHERAALDRAKSSGGIALRPGGVYLFTGGLGGMSLALAEHMAKEARARIVLLSRTSLPARAEWTEWLAAHGPSDPTSVRIGKCLSIERAGGELLLASADVTDVEEMRSVLARVHDRFGRIDGVVHAAGVLKDEPLQAKTQSDTEDVFTPKVHGTLVLDELLRDADLDFLLLCSSTSALTGAAGQIDYAAANAFLDAYAQSRAESKTRVLSVNWGIWREVGMAADALRKLAPDENGARMRREPIDHAFFDAKIADTGSAATLVADLSASKHWVLDEHRTKAGQALLPGTGYIELARAALTAHGEAKPFEIRDLYFLRPLHVPDGEIKEVWSRLREDEEGFAFTVASVCTTDGGRRALETHAQARLLLHDLPLPGSIDLAAIEARCTRVVKAEKGSTLASEQESHLAFGPRWRVLREVRYGAHEALAHLELAPELARDLADFALHPGLLDLATGFAMELIDGYSGHDGLWVPVSYKEIRVHRALAREIRSFVSCRPDTRAERGFAAFDVVITDARGEVLLEIREFSIKRLTSGADFALAPKPVERELEFLPSEGDRSTRTPSPAEAALQHNLAQGILPAEGAAAVQRILAAERRPQVVVSSLDLDALAKQAEHASAQAQVTGDTFARPELESEFVEARDGIERTLVGFWQELLGVDRVGIKDSFFDLGGHSLIAVRLFAKIKKAYQVDFPISVLFEAPTIERCAELVRQATGATTDAASDASSTDAARASGTRDVHRPRFVHLVSMHTKQGSRARPFFLVAGMFGNVLNLRHLAGLIGADRPFYGLQARGLYGDHTPHETFEETARDYVKELKSVQPEGPYLLGGFSGGGVTAFEMAQQLTAAGEEVALLAMLDTPLPQSPRLSAHERALIHLQRARKKGPSYFTDWAKNRVQWELDRLKKRKDGPGVEREGAFHSATIEAAFRRALLRYEVRGYTGRITLFRPKLDLAHVLGPGRVTNAHREFVFHDNGWGPHASEVVVHEVPGDHDGMVLEPNVRVLAARLRRAIQAAEAAILVPRSKAS